MRKQYESEASEPREGLGSDVPTEVFIHKTSQELKSAQGEPVTMPLLQHQTPGDADKGI